MALFNELYALTDGGTLWSAVMNAIPRVNLRFWSALIIAGTKVWTCVLRFFALLMLWPDLEKSVVLAFARAISAGDDTPRIIGWNQASAIRKLSVLCCTYLGAPERTSLGENQLY